MNVLHKKLIALLIATFLTLSLNIPALAASETTGFSDVAGNAWYAEAVEYVSDNGLMSGTTATTFEPTATTSRAMLVTVLYRQAGSPTPAQTSHFTDVAAGSWYSNAVSWAAANNIVDGYPDGRFCPTDPVTRQQLAVILWRSAGQPEPETSETFADQSAISSYAVSAIAWAKENNIVSGKNGNLFDPAGQATRAETAAILYRFATMDSVQPNVPAAPETPNTPEAPDTQETAITITVGDTVIPATLNSSVSARDLISRLPLTVSMTRGPADYYSNLSDPLDSTETDVHSGWHNGDIGFDGTYLTMFHAGEETSASYNNQITLGRISDLTLLDNLGNSIQATFALASAQPAKPDTPDIPARRTLVVYYSYSQRTEKVAQLLQEELDGDIYELTPAVPYTGSSSEVSQRAQEEVASGSYPALSGTLPDLSQYDTILIGGPVWSGTLAAPLYTYLQETDFAGKTVAPFWTDQGTPGNYAQDFTSAVQNADRVTEFLQLTNTTSISSGDMSQRLDTWLANIFA
ncbi:MAG: S-layer homology domain-containing protein [Oscillospiraceae bacterium]|nr:S-layer homology domain-containing protein [Oscillospiraceae bacterium]